MTSALAGPCGSPRAGSSAPAGAWLPNARSRRCRGLLCGVVYPGPAPAPCAGAGPVEPPPAGPATFCVERYARPGLLGRPTSPQGSTDCGVSCRRRALGTCRSARAGPTRASVCGKPGLFRLGAGGLYGDRGRSAPGSSNPGEARPVRSRRCRPAVFFAASPRSGDDSVDAARHIVRRVKVAGACRQPARRGAGEHLCQ